MMGVMEVVVMEGSRICPGSKEQVEEGVEERGEGEIG